MNVKHQFAIAALLTQAAGQIQSAEEAKAQIEAAMSESEQAANELYLDDLTEASAEDDIEGESDSSVATDVEKRRLGQMSESMFAELDADGSGGLTREEFLAGPVKRAEDKNMTDEEKLKLAEKMGADFDTYAGADSLLSPDELKTLLSNVAPRVGKHRKKHHPGTKHEDRLQTSLQGLKTKFDADGDGKIGPQEVKNMQSTRKEQVGAVRQGRMPPMPPKK